MEVILLDSTFKELYVIDLFKSLIWTDRYFTCGDFEIVTEVNNDIWPFLAETKYLRMKESAHLMRLELINIKYEGENGHELILKGRSIESLLDIRIIWDLIATNSIDNNLQDAVEALLNASVIDATITSRNIPNFIFTASTDPTITALTIDEQFNGEILYDVICNICYSKGIGFKITLTANNEFNFELYNGADRSYNQETNPHVVFSPSFDNLNTSEYISSDQLLKTVALVAGEEGVGNIRTTVVVNSPDGAGTGLSRRELYVDAKSITRNLPGGGQLTEEEYLVVLEGKGLEELSKHIVIEAFDGDVDTTMFNYGEDFFMGDILQIEDEFGNTGRTRVIEIIFSQDPSEIKIYPTFNAVL